MIASRTIHTVQIDAFARREPLDRKPDPDELVDSHIAVLAALRELQCAVTSLMTDRGPVADSERIEPPPPLRKIFDALPMSVVTLRVHGLGAHDLDQPQCCPIARTLDGLIASARDGTVRIAHSLKTVDLRASAPVRHACERCELRVMAFQGACDRRQIAFSTTNVLAEVRRLPTR